MNQPLARRIPLFAMLPALLLLCSTCVAETVIYTASAEAKYWSSLQDFDSGTEAGHVYDAQVSADGCSASSRCIARIDQGVGAESAANCTPGTLSELFAQASVTARQVFTVTAGGSFSVPIDFSGMLAIPTPGNDFQAYGSGVFAIEVKDSYNTWGVLDPDNADFYFDLANVCSGGSAYNKTYGLAVGEFSWNGGALAWSAKRTLAAELEPGTYCVYMSINAVSNSKNWSGSGQTVFDSYNSIKFDGSDFWSTVQGTAQFHDPADPTKSHVPEPATLTLLASLLIFACSTRVGKSRNLLLRLFD